MHTKQIPTVEYGEVIVNHNSDWSGLVCISWTQSDGYKQVWLPGEWLLKVANEAKKDELTGKIISFIENL